MIIIDIHNINTSNSDKISFDSCQDLSKIPQDCPLASPQGIALWHSRADRVSLKSGTSIGQHLTELLEVAYGSLSTHKLSPKLQKIRKSQWFTAQAQVEETWRLRLNSLWERLQNATPDHWASIRTDEDIANLRFQILMHLERLQGDGQSLGLPLPTEMLAQHRDRELPFEDARFLTNSLLPDRSTCSWLTDMPATTKRDLSEQANVHLQCLALGQGAELNQEEIAIGYAKLLRKQTVKDLTSLKKIHEHLDRLSREVAILTSSGCTDKHQRHALAQIHDCLQLRSRKTGETANHLWEEAVIRILFNLPPTQVRSGWHNLQKLSLQGLELSQHQHLFSILTVISGLRSGATQSQLHAQARHNLTDESDS